MKGLPDWPPLEPVNDNSEGQGGILSIKQEGFIEEPAGAGSVERAPVAEESIVLSNPVLEAVAGRARSAAKRGGKASAKLVLTESGPETIAPQEATEEKQTPVIEDGTPKENREALATVVVPEIDRLREVQERLRNQPKIEDDAPKKSVVAEAERANVQAKEAEYLEAYKGLEKKSNFLNRILKGRELKDESVRVEALKRSYDEARVAYGNALTSSAAARLEGKGVSTLGAERVLNRYNRLVRFNEVVRPAAEKRIQARIEALDSRGQSAFDKGLVWVGRKNAWLEKAAGGKIQAKAVRAAATTILVVGGAALLGSVGTTSLLALAGFGSYKFMRSFGGSMLAAGGGELAGRGYKKFFGKKAQEAARASLRTAGRNPSGASELTLTDLQKVDKKREKLAITADEATLEKKALIFKALAAFGLGAGAVGIAELLSMQHAADVIAGADLTSDQVKGIEGLMSGSSAHHDLPAQAPSVPEAAPAAPAPETSSSLKVVATEAPAVPHAAAPESVAVPTQVAPEAPVPESVAPSTEAVPPTEPTAPAEAMPPATSSLPEGMDPDSAEAASYLTKSHNPEVFATAEPVPGAGTELPDASAHESAQVAESPTDHAPTDGAMAHETGSPEPEAAETPAPEDAAPVEPSPEVKPAELPEAGTQPDASTGGATHPSEAPAPDMSHNAPEQTPPVSTESFVNTHGLSIDKAAPHLYNVPDNGAPGGKQLVIFGGENLKKEIFEAQVRSIALAHPGQEIMYQASEPVMRNGTLVPWISSITANADGSFVIPAGSDAVGEGFIDKRIDPNSLTTLIR